MNAILIALLALVIIVSLVIIVVSRVRAARVVAATAISSLYEEAAAAAVRRGDAAGMRASHAIYLAKEARLASKREYLITLAKGAGYSDAFRGHPADYVSLQGPGYKSWIKREDLRDQVLTMIEEDLAN